MVWQTQPVRLTHVAFYLRRSPEQFGDGRVTARCDVWAWACVFVFMLTGTQPWHGLDVMQITVKVRR